MIAVTFSRTSLSLPDLTITGDFTQPYWIPSDGFAEPEFDPRVTLADDSPHVPGSLATQAVLATGSLPLTIYTRAADEVTLKAQKRALEATVWQFRYTTAVTIVGAPDTYRSHMGRITWGAVTADMVGALMSRCAVTIPVQPLGA